MLYTNTLFQTVLAAYLKQKPTFVGKRHTMRFSLILLVFYATTVSCQSWEWVVANGSDGIDIGTGIARDQQNNVLVCGHMGDYGVFNGQQVWGKGLSDAFICKYNSIGEFQWVKTAGSRLPDKATAVTTDAQGNIFITGNFRDTATFNTSMVFSLGNNDVFVAKYNATGNLLWVRSGGSSNTDQALSIATDATGNVYVCGYYTGTFRFGGSSISTGNIYAESFVMKLDANGNTQWLVSTKATKLNTLNGVAVNSNHEIFVAGYFTEQLQWGSDTLREASSNFEVYIAKLNNSGQLLWLRKAGGSYDDVATAIAADAQGNAYIAGYFSGTASFGNNTLNLVGYTDAFIAKYDNNGTCLWARSMGNTELDAAYSIAIDAQGNPIVAGMYQNNFLAGGHLLSGPGKQIFVVSYDSDGQYRWAQEAGESGTDCALGVTTTSDNRILLTGYYLYRCKFGNKLLPLPTAEDFFIAKLIQPTVGISAINNEYVKLLFDPGRKVFTLRSANLHAQPWQLNIYDMQGRVVCQEKINNNENLIATTLRQGVYTYLLQYDLIQIRGKIAIQE